MHANLTEKFVASVQLPKGAVQLDVFDTSYPALCLRVGRHSKAWTIHFRDSSGKQHRKVLGRYPAMTLAQAREAWRQARSNTSSTTFMANPTLTSHIVAEWLQSWERGKRPNTVRDVTGHIRRTILPAWGVRQISNISKRDVHGMLDGFRDKPRSAHHLFNVLRQLFDWCLRRDIIKIDPMAGLKRNHFGAVKARDRVLTDWELAKIVSWCRGSNEYDPDRAATLLLVLTGARTDMIARLRWNEVNCDTISFPGEHMKTGEAFELPITTQMRRVLDGIPRTNSPRVFHKVMLRDRAKKRIDAATGIVGWVLHDIRRTVSTGMQRLGVPPDVIDAVQAHFMTGIKPTYQRHHFAAEKRHALEKWGAFVAAL